VDGTDVRVRSWRVTREDHMIGKDQVGVTDDGALVGAEHLVRGSNMVEAKVGKVVLGRWPEARVPLVLPRMRSGVVSWTNSTWFKGIIRVHVCRLTVFLFLLASFPDLLSLELWLSLFKPNRLSLSWTLSPPLLILRTVSRGCPPGASH
jgi:hypothetical protein